jgi:hypothetical protein
MQAAAFAEKRYTITISSAYRDLKTQTKIQSEVGTQAAAPGGSAHGWGGAIDIRELFRLNAREAERLNVLKTSPVSNANIRNTSELYAWLRENGPKYGWYNPARLADGAGTDECWHFEYWGFWTLGLGGVGPFANAPITPRPENISPRTNGTTGPINGTPVQASTITPFIASLDSFHPNIQYELTRRRFASETANVYTPFVKLTSLMYVDRENLNGPTYAWCPTLGVHGEQDVEFDDIYLPKDLRSIVGYANTIDGKAPVVVSEDDVSVDQENIPMPGITSMTTERNTAGGMGVRGGLFRATIKITAYSVGQLNALLRYYLRPATNVILEFGMVSSNPEKTEPIRTYDWSKSADKIHDEIKDLISGKTSQREFIQNYVYDNNGNYELFIGYVVKFDLRYTKNNTYEITLTVHSVQQFEVPSKYTGARAKCDESIKDKCKVLDIYEYFDDKFSWKDNSFNALMSAVQKTDDPYSSKWSTHVIPIKDTGTSGGGANSRDGGAGEGGYYVSWRFFVDVLLNDTAKGIMSVFQFQTQDNEVLERMRSGMIRPLGDAVLVNTTADGAVATDLLANEVGYHPNLRSTDPGILILYNNTAQTQGQVSGETQAEIDRLANLAEISLDDDTVYSKIANSAKTSVEEFKSIDGKTGTTFLTNGVWLNTNMIKDAFTSTDSVAAALSKMLSAMNSAVESYWNLQLLSNDNTAPGLHVVDMLSKTTNKSVNGDYPQVMPDDILQDNDISPQMFGDPRLESGKPTYLYNFNSKTKMLVDDDLGSELVDLNVVFDLPHIVAVQAITGIGGFAQRSVLESINVNELKRLSLIPDLYVTCTKEDANAAARNDQSKPCPNNPAEASPVPGTKDAAYLQAEREFEGRPLIESYYVALEARAKEIRKSAELQQNTELVNKIRNYSGIGSAIKLIELNPPAMLQKLDLDSKSDNVASNSTHPFGSSNLTKTVIDISMPGIGGIQLFQSFAVSRMPAILKYGYYVVTKVNHEFSPRGGWITKIQGRFRSRPQPPQTSAPIGFVPGRQVGEGTFESIS